MKLKIIFNFNCQYPDIKMYRQQKAAALRAEEGVGTIASPH